ncbi:glycosyltransferase family 2 protein [Paracoccus sanguinis]|uniref:Glycosyl transferase family 2 n=1 Tax=Paracoccus sanguinis TaxID=1545044 RepID=A0A1H2WQN7_9RHOB|nr:glycosyltransferase family 2 protein [Paracoccus sanguinis]SDW82574.1 Glycosyl transferase family 2 [Paracoccus sanguinis]
MRLMISTMRDEAPFVLEWIAYHRLIGFTDFLIYSNDCTDGTDALLDRLAALGIVTHVPNPRQGKKAIQWQALTRAKDHPLFRAADWAMVADVDEFLVIHAGDGRLDDLFAAVPEAEGFVVTWRMFGSGGILRFDPAPVTSQFRRAAPDRMIWPLRASQVKTLFRVTPDVRRLGVHLPQGKAGAAIGAAWVDGNGARVRRRFGSFTISTEPKYALAQVNHYALGSAESFLVKTRRGRPNRSDMAIDLAYWVERNFNAVEDLSIQRHLPGIEAGIAALRADPEVARLHDAGIAHRRARIAALLREHESFLLYSHLVQVPDTPVLPMDQQLALCELRRHAQPDAKGRADEG